MNNINDPGEVEIPCLKVLCSSLGTGRSRTGEGDVGGCWDLRYCVRSREENVQRARRYVQVPDDLLFQQAVR